jgi:hypothetical protein
MPHLALPISTQGGMVFEEEAVIILYYHGRDLRDPVMPAARSTA